MKPAPAEPDRGRPCDPPAIAEALLARILPDGDLGRTILGDLRQELDERCGRVGARSLALWYWAQALRLGGRYAWRRLGGMVVGSEPGGGRGRGPSSARLTTRGGEVLPTLLADARYGLRTLARTPLLSFFAILTIALGVGLTSQTFSFVYGSVLRGVQVPGAGRLVVLSEAIPARNIEQDQLPIQDYLDFRDQLSSFEFLAASTQGTVNLAGDEGPPERYAGGFMSSNAFTGLGVAPLMGRTFRVGEDLPGAPPVLLLGYDVWKNRFAGDPNIVGRSVRTNGEAATVIGVMPQGFRFPFHEDLWVTHRIDKDAAPRRSGAYVDVFGRLKDGVSLGAANAEVASVAARIAELHPDENEGVHGYLMPYEDRYMPPRITAVLFLMLGATFGVLLIACVNVANLMLARAMLRSRDVAIRRALGASRLRVARQLLTESLIIGIAGGMGGLALSYAGIVAMNAAILDIEKPYWIDIRLDGPALLFTLAVTLAAAVVAGTLPAVRASAGDSAKALRDETRGTSSFRLGRFSAGLVVTELAVSCALLIAAGLMVKSIVNLETLDLGFETEGILTARVGLFESEYPTAQDRHRFFREVVGRLEAEPGVRSVALASALPGLGTGRWRVAVEGEAYDDPADQPVVNGTFVGGSFFSTYGVTVRRGRDLTREEAFDGTNPVAVVNESLVRRLFPDRDPLGMTMKVGAPDSEGPWFRIVGVVPDLHVGGGVGGLGSDRVPPEGIYLSAGSWDLRFMSLVIGTEGPPEALASAVRAVVADLDPNLPLYDVRSQARALEEWNWAFGLFGSLFSIFGIIALLLAAVGLYGVMAFSVARRRQEMGVRMALGADGRTIVRLVLGRGALQLGLGLAIGLAMGAGMGVPLRAVTFGVEAWDPAVYASVLSTLLITGLLAMLVPALRATRVDPNAALRQD